MGDHKREGTSRRRRRRGPLTYSDPKKRKPGDGRPYYTRRYDSSTQKSAWINLHVTNKAEAEDLVADYRAAAHSGDPLELRQAKAAARRITASDLMEQWLAARSGRVSTKHYDTIEARIETFWKPEFGAKPVEAITTADLDRYLDRRRTNKAGNPKYRKETDLSDASMNTELIALRSLFNFAVKRRLIDDSPAAAIVEYTGAVASDRQKYLEPKEVERLLRACSESTKVTATGHRNKSGRGDTGKRTKKKSKWTQTYTPKPWLKPMVVMAMNLGLRMSSLVGMQWKHIDLESSTIELPGLLMKRRSKKEPFEEHLNQDIVEALTEYRTKLSAPELAGEARVFAVSTDAVKKAFRRARERAKLPRVAFHSLRGHCANALLEAGFDDTTICAITRHSPATLSKHYKDAGRQKRKRREALDAISTAGRGKKVRRNSRASGRA